MKAQHVMAALLLMPMPALAATGSGTVNFAFTGFAGPFASVDVGLDPTDPAQWRQFGLINGILPSVTGTTPFRFGQDYVLGQASLTGPSASLLYAGERFTSDPARFENIISFTPASFADVTSGADFILGTISFKNGGWFGGTDDVQFNTPFQLDFTLTTMSTTPDFNQTITGSIKVVTNVPAPLDCATLGGQQDQADFLSVVSGATIGTLGSLRVYDQDCAPTGVASTGTIDLVGRFGSLELVALTNPTGGGFFVPGTDPGPIGGVPEPDSWVLLIMGFGLVGAVLRRRGMVAAEA